MRQAKESDIICVSMDIREGKKLHPYKGNDIQIFKRNDLVDGMYFWADQILCATNNSRKDINMYTRKLLGRGDEPEIGDKVICGRNCWDKVSVKENNPLVNGTIGYIKEMQLIEKPYYFGGSIHWAPVLESTISVSDDEYSTVDVDYKDLTTNEKFFTPPQEYLIRKNKKNIGMPIDFNYGYAITVHKS